MQLQRSQAAATTRMPAAGREQSIELERTPRSSLDDSAARPVGMSLAEPTPSGHDDDLQDDVAEPTADSDEDDVAPRPLLQRWTSTDDEEDQGDDSVEDEDEEYEDGETNFARLSGQFETYAEAGQDPQGSLTKGQRRRVYGGGKAAEGGRGLSVFQVAGGMLMTMSNATPLLMPHAAALLGLPLFLPLLFLTAALAWFSHVVLGVSSRYVGAGSWSSLTSAVFPHRLKAHKAGEILSAVLIVFTSITRAVVNVVASSEVIVELVVPENKRRTWERTVIVIVICVLWTFLPLFVLPLFRSKFRRRLLSTTQMPPYLAFLFWPLALLILGVRVKGINAAKQPPTLLPRQSFPTEAMGLSVWGGISLLVFSLSIHQDSFKFLTSLARPSSIAASSSTSLSPSTQSRNSRRRRSDAWGEDDDGSYAARAGARDGDREGKRNQWPLAAALGVGGATIIQMGWGLVGYLGIEDGGREGNILSSTTLPRGDGWLGLVRVLVITTMLAGLEEGLQGSYGRLRKGLEAVQGAVGLGKKEDNRRRSMGYEQMASSSSSPQPAAARRRWDWTSALSRVLVWVGVCLLGVSLTKNGGDKGRGIVSVAQISGVVANCVLGFLVPSIFFIVLFHLRRPRSIFITDPSSPVFTTDTLLMRKERQVQRKLSGRRLWQDVCVFGGLLPFGVVVFVRGCVAIAKKG